MSQLQRASFHSKINYILAIGTEALAPLFRLAEKLWIKQNTSLPVKWQRCLILGDNHIGDTLYRTCSLAALKHGLPNCDFYYLTTPSSASLLENNPYIKAVLPFSNSDFSGAINTVAFKQLERLSFDSVLITNPIKYWPDLLFALKLKIPNRAAYIHKGFSGLVTHPVKFHFPQPFPSYFRSFVAQLTNQEPTWDLQPEVYHTLEDQKEADSFYRSLNLASDTKLIACFITSRQTMANWGIHNYADVLIELNQRYGLIPILMGAKDDYSKLTSLQKALPHPSYIAAGNLSLPALVLFLKKCCLTFCIDSGPRHLSNAARIPVFFFRHLAFQATEAGVYYSKEHDLCPAISYCSIDCQKQIFETINPQKVAQSIIKEITIKEIVF